MFTKLNINHNFSLQSSRKLKFQHGKVIDDAWRGVSYYEADIEMDTEIKKYIPEKYTSIIIHDCDVIIKKEVLDKLEQNSLAITNYKLDGKKYGFVELDQNFNYLKGNEKETETGHISIGAYSVNGYEFNNYLKLAVDESLLSYYNICSNPKVVYSKQHTNLGDINSYINNLWLL